MLFEHGNIQIQLTGNRNDFNGTMLLTKVELAKTNVAIQVTELSLVGDYCTCIMKKKTSK